MCTLTYIPLNNRVLICSNRDEIPDRSFCKILKTDSGTVYPAEPLKGGTWISANKHRVLVLLNGAFEKHLPNPNYTKSRGVLLVELSDFENPIAELKQLDLSRIEPFTLVSIQKNELVEFRWTGTESHVSNKDTSQAHIWSSATLYDIEARSKREQLFNEFFNLNNPNESSQWEFHTKLNEDLENGIVIKRENGPQTISTTQVVLESKEIKFNYYDHIRGTLNKL